MTIRSFGASINSTGINEVRLQQIKSKAGLQLSLLIQRGKSFLFQTESL